MTRIKAILKKEFRQLFRDKRSLGVLLFLPLFLLIMFGYAVSLDVKNVHLAVYDGANSPESRLLVAKISQSEQFDLKYMLRSTSEIDALMDNEKIKVALVIPKGFSTDLLRGDTAHLQIILDGSNASSAASAAGYMEAMIQDYSKSMLIQTLKRSRNGSLTAPVEYRPRVWFNPELRSARFLIPGLIAFILVITCVVSTSLSIVREKEQGTMEQLTVSPLRPMELLIGKTVPYVLISLAITGAILLVTTLLFAVSIKGSFLLLLLVTLLFIFACLSLGILISTVADTQQVAFMLGVIITILPSFILSGFVFPIRNMPGFIQGLTYLFPARYFLTALRSIMLKGVGLRAFWGQLLGLILFTALALTASIIRLKRERG